MKASVGPPLQPLQTTNIQINSRIKGEHDVNVLREYIEFFPKSGLAKALDAYLESELSPFPILEKMDEDGNPINKPVDGAGDDESIAPDQRIDTMIVRQRAPGDYELD